MSRKQATIQKSLTTADRGLDRMPRPLEQLSESEIKRKQYISRIMTYVLKNLTCKFVDSEFEWLLPVVFSKSTDPLWPDPGASIEKRIEVEIWKNRSNDTEHDSS